MGATFGILGRLAGGFATAADEQRESEHKANREQRLGIMHVLQGILNNPNTTDDTREAVVRNLLDLATAKPGKKVAIDLGKLGLSAPPPPRAALSALPQPQAPPPAVQPPPEVTPPPQAAPPPTGGQFFTTRQQRLNREAARERVIKEAGARGRAAGTPRPPVKLQRVQIDDPNKPGQTIFVSFSPETGRFQDTKGKNIEFPLAPKRETTHTPYLDFREGQIATGVPPGDIPKLWNQQQVALQQRNPSRMGLILSGIDSQTGEPVFVWVSGEQRMRGEIPPSLVGIRPRLGGREEAKRLDTIVRSLLGAYEKGARLYKLLGIALNPDLEGKDKEAVKAGRAAYVRWLKGPKRGTSIRPPPDEGAGAPPTTAEEYLQRRKPKR